MTLVILRVSQAAFEEIAGRIRDAGADDLFMPGGQINMHGIALERDPDARLPPSIVEVDAHDINRDAFRRIYGLDMPTTTEG